MPKDEIVEAIVSPPQGRRGKFLRVECRPRRACFADTQLMLLSQRGCKGGLPLGPLSRRRGYRADIKQDDRPKQDDHPKEYDLTKFGDPTPYNITFGPDKRGYTKRTHAIFNCKFRNILKKSDLACKQEDEGTSHLNSMIIKPVNIVCVEFDEEKLREARRW